MSDPKPTDLELEAVYAAEEAATLMCGQTPYLGERLHPCILEPKHDGPCVQWTHTGELDGSTMGPRHVGVWFYKDQGDGYARGVAHADLEGIPSAQEMAALYAALMLVEKNRKPGGSDAV